MSEQTFTTLERDGWSRNAAAYSSIILDWTSQAFEPLLNGFTTLQGRRLLDVASGTGHLAKVASEKGAIAEGIDISSEMVLQASRNFPLLRFSIGNAQKLPYADSSFDAVTCCFGLLHMEQPEKAIREAFRVLRTGGQFGYTVWYGPPKGELMSIVLKTFQRLANMEVGLPPAPPMFQFAEAETRDRVLHEVGFKSITTVDVDIRWRAAKSADIERLLKEGMVRSRMVFERQTPAVQCEIIEVLISEAGKYETKRGVEIPNSAVVVTATKT